MLLPELIFLNLSAKFGSLPKDLLKYLMFNKKIKDEVEPGPNANQIGLFK